MKKILKIFGITVASLIGLLFVLVIILKLIPDSQYRSWITSAVKSSTGRDFYIQTLELDLGSSVRFSADGIRLANAEWAENGDMLNVGRVEAELKILPLLAGRAEFRTVLKDADLVSQGNEQGISNWDLSAGRPPEEDEEEDKEIEAPDIDDESRGLPIRPVIRELKLENINLTLQKAPDAEVKRAQLNHLRILTPEADTSLALEASANGIPIQLNGTLGNIEQALDKASTPLALEGLFDQNQLKVLGEWGPVIPEANLDMEIDLKVPSTSALATIAGYDIGDFGVLELNAHLSAAEGIMAVDDIVTRLDGEQTSTSLDGSITNLLLMDGINLAFQADTDALHHVIQELNIELPVPLPPEVHISAKLQGGKNGLSINDINAEIRDEGLQLALTGKVDNLLSSRQVKAEFHGSADSLSRLSKYANMELPDLGLLALSGKLVSEGEAIGLNTLDASLSADNLKLNVTGGVQNLLTVNGIDAQTELTIDSLTEQNISELVALLESYKVELPADLLPQSIRLSTTVQGDLEALSLKDVEAQVKDQGIDIQLTGEVANVLKPEGILADITLNSDSVASFSKYAGTELPDLGPLVATAKINSREDSIGLESLHATLAGDPLKAEINASIADLLAVSGINVEVKADTDTLAALSDLAQTELPDTDPVSVLMTLAADNLEQAKVNLHASTAGATIDADSSLSLLKIADKLSLDVSVNAETLADFNKLAQMEFRDDGPLELSTSLNIQPRHFTLSDLKLLLAEDQSATGNLELKLPEPGNEQDITTLHGKLDIPYLDLTPFLPKPVPEEELDEIETEVTSQTQAPSVDEGAHEAPPVEEPLDPSERLLSSEPFVYDKLRDYDIDLTINSNKLDIGEAKLHDIALAVTLQEGLLSVKPIQAYGGETGTLEGSLTLDGRSSIPVLDTDITLTQFPMPNLGGALDLHVNIDGQGVSVAELMASLNGQVLLVMKDGKIDKGLVSRFGSGLFSFSGEQDTTAVECAILRVDIVDGVADFERKLAAQLTEVTWRGGGKVDFNTERIKADIVPKPRKGIPISVGGTLAGLVSLSGTLKNPKIAPDYSDAAIKYGKYSAYIATGGLSLLAEMIANKVTSNQDVCGQILDGTVFETAEKANPPR